MLNNNENIIVKYYKQTLAYNDEWYKYKPKYNYYDEASNDFNISKPFKCNEPWDEISKVYFKNNKAYKDNIPFKLIGYCSKFFIHNTTNEESYIRYITSKRKYDREGRLMSIIYPQLKKNKVFKYIKNTKEITTYYTDSNKTKTSKYVYTDNKNLLKILQYQNEKQTSVYLFDNKDKNILLEYDMEGKLTGNIKELYENASKQKNVLSKQIPRIKND